MTAYEMLDLAQSSYSTSAAYISIFIALLSAYLVGSYIAGSRLSTAQFLLANGLYLVIQTLTILTIYNFNSTARYWGNRGRADMPLSGESADVTHIPEIVALVLVVTMLLSVWFMWKSRNPKTE